MKYAIKSTRNPAPILALIHGDGGVGKSTLAASAPRTIFVAAEDGLRNLDTRSVEPFPTVWSEVIEALDYIRSLPITECTTVAIDSLDWLEPLCWAEVCRKGGKRILGKDGEANIQHIEAFGYGKGYNAALDEWRVFLNALKLLRAQGRNILLIAHSVRKVVKNPEGEDYEQWQIKLHEKAAGLIKEWVDIVGFASHEVVTAESKGRVKGLSTGKRVLRTQPNAAYDAKTRYAMPASIPLDWASFEQAVKNGTPEAVVARLKTEFDTRLHLLADPEVEKGARMFVEERGANVASLSEAIGTINAYLAERKAAS